ncbi:MAG: cystathionine beta-lyase, partial [Firmicutes bacterium]|nr:cystathionine beta-lyase [Bacillota bacterium]
MKYDFDKIIDRRGTYASKTDAMPEGCPEDALPAWVADMDLECAEPILKAIRQRVDHGILGYTRYSNRDCKEAVMGWYKRRFGWEINHEHLFYSPGVVPAIGMLLQA